MKIVEEHDIASPDPRRFEVTARTSNALLLRDNEIGKVYHVRMSEDDWPKIVNWNDNDWWHFIYIDQRKYIP